MHITNAEQGGYVWLMRLRRQRITQEYDHPYRLGGHHGTNLGIAACRTGENPFDDQPRTL